MCETIEKIALLSVHFLVFYESKKYFKGTLFSLKMWYLNKQGQQATSKISKHPDEVTRFDGTHDPQNFISSFAYDCQNCWKKVQPEKVIH